MIGKKFRFIDERDPSKLGMCVTILREKPSDYHFRTFVALINEDSTHRAKLTTGHSCDGALPDRGKGYFVFDTDGNSGVAVGSWALLNKRYWEEYADDNDFWEV